MAETKWVDWFFAASAMPLYAASQTSVEMGKTWGAGYGVTIITIDSGKGRWSSPKGKMLQIGEIAIRKLKDPKFKRKVWRQFEGACSSLEKIFGKIDRENLASLEDRSLFKLYRELYAGYYRLWDASIFVDGIPIYGESILIGLHGEKGNKLTSDKARLLSRLLYPTKKSFLARENQERMEIARLAVKSRDAKYGQLPAFLKRKITAHARKWFWIGNNNITSQRLDAIHFWELIRGTGEEKAQMAKIALAERLKIIAALGLPANAIELVSMMDEFSYFQDRRKEYWIRAIGYLDEVLFEIGKRKGYPKSALKNAFPWEIGQLESGKRISREELNARSRFSITIYRGKIPQILVGNKARRKYGEYFGGEALNEELVELHGICACAGKVIGRAAILTSARDVPKLKAGDIMIAPSTDPEYIVAMKKAAAIVTDEGGITSHAAIVSRELGIPCLVGTKHATKVFRNGEMVELDANHGVIRRLK
ncbi:MAG TPA: PEP-utilizing enzyme [Candidatus Norongarragalinales archaeon]|nr:PEP-utilizing enzyme [Candidatus Norongarragalinales archaeon]